MRIAWYACRATWRQSWRVTVVVALIGGLLGAVALGALAGARRTDSAYGRYLRSVNASDVMVDIPGPILPAITAVEHAPGVTSSAAWIGMDADPVIDGKIDYSFLTNALAGSIGDEFYGQDKVTVLAGKLPSPHAANEIVLTQSMADAFLRQGVRFHVGDRMTWQFYRLPWKNGHLARDAPPPPTRAVTFRIAAIVAVSPALADQFDDTATAIMTPAATAPYLPGCNPARPADCQWDFGWASLRMRSGDAGVLALQNWLTGYGQRLMKNPVLANYGPYQFSIRRLSTVQHEAQQAIWPQALALTVLAGLAALALTLLMAQGLAQLLSRPAADAPTLRALGASRTETAAATAGWGVVAVVAAILLSIAGAIAVSPLAPVGPVREYDPARGVQADWLVLAGGGAVLLLILLAQLAWLAWRAVRQGRELPAPRASALVAGASRAALPVTMGTGIRHALERGTGRLKAPVLVTLTGSVVAVAALVAALVFGASLTGLTTHPARYGWNWNLLIESSGGWGSWPLGARDPLVQVVKGQPGVLGWSELGFAQAGIGRTEFPVMGVVQHGRAVEPPTTSGHPLTGENQIEFGTETMRQLGLHLGEHVHIGDDPDPITVVGTVTLPSFGVVLTDHVSLGRGAMTSEYTLLKILHLGMNPSESAENVAVAAPVYPSAAVFDFSSKADGDALARRIINFANAQPGNEGSVYPLSPQLGAPVRNASQMGSQPRTLAIGVAIAAVLALGLTILASVRERRRDLALLKALGLRSRQIRAVVGWQTTTILVIAIAAGVPLGIAAGNWLWTTFANSIGVVPLPVVPATALVAGIGALLVGGNLLALWPAHLAARIAPAATFRTE
jgi:hypothetical protein